jgi:hypothetical protein
MSLLNNLFGSGAQNAAQGIQGAMGSTQQAQNLLAAQQGNISFNPRMTLNSSGIGIGAGSQSTVHTGKITGETHQPATSKELEHEAYNVSVSSLIDLWVTRYGNEWIDLVDVEGDNFFRLAYRRLKQMGELETHYLTDRARYVCRRPE